MPIWGAIFGGLVSGIGSYLAAGTQVAGTDYAANLQSHATANSLAFAKQMWGQQQSNMEPWIAQGRGAVTMLGQLMGVPSMPTTPVAGQTFADDQRTEPPVYTRPADTPGTTPVGTAVPKGTVPPPAATPDPGRPGGGGRLSTGPRTNSLGDVYSGADPGSPDLPLTPSGPNQPSRMVRIAWPDGSQSQVESDSLQQYQLLGAKVVA